MSSCAQFPAQPVRRARASPRRAVSPRSRPPTAVLCARHSAWPFDSTSGAPPSSSLYLLLVLKLFSLLFSCPEGCNFTRLRASSILVCANHLHRCHSEPACRSPAVAGRQAQRRICFCFPLPSSQIPLLLTPYGPPAAPSCLDSSSRTRSRPGLQQQPVIKAGANGGEACLPQCRDLLLLSAATISNRAHFASTCHLACATVRRFVILSLPAVAGEAGAAKNLPLLFR